MTFLPTTKQEAAARGWDALDVILVSGDAYIDSPFIGVAVIGKVLVAAGYRVGIISQPDISGPDDISRLGEPRLFWGVTGGCIDSMIANYTPTKKRRRTDDMTPGGENRRRPDRAVIAYANLIRRHFKGTRPIILGGIEASLRRVSHYDYWTDAVRRSILFDAKADILVHGMGEATVIELAGRLAAVEPVTDIRGICHISPDKPEGFIELPSHEEASRNKDAFAEMFRQFYVNNDAINAVGMVQRQDTRYLVHNPPRPLPSTSELDRIHELPYARDVHPGHRADGEVRALETIRFSIATHRGCYGECRFCAIAVHQGRTIVDRSEASILREAENLTRHPGFKGVIQDVGGPTANMYGIECALKKRNGPCRDKRCLAPAICRHLPVSHRRQIDLLRKLRAIPGIKHVFIASGIRHDLILNDKKHGMEYLGELITHHVSGQLKIAPEHSEPRVLELMGKPEAELTERFVDAFDKINRKLEKPRFLTCYLMAAHPGCTLEDMHRLKRFIKKTFRFNPEQIQIFTPSPSTVATLIYHTRRSWDGDRPLFVETDLRGKEQQKQAIVPGSPPGGKRC